MGDEILEILFCTITTKYRLYQCIALYNSLRRFLPEVKLAVLCMDEDTEMLLKNAEFPGIIPIPLGLLENEELKAVKTGRSLNEYCWTLKPVLLQHLFEEYKNVDVISYLDSDLYFFESPTKLFSGNRDWNVMVTTHKVNRKVNSGFIAFRRNKIANNALSWWREKCLEWCFCRKERERFGDQGHLDSLRKMFSGIKYLEMPGVNIAPWNCFNYDFSFKRGRMYIGRCRLIFFHFSGFRLRQIGSSTFTYESDIPCTLCSVYCKEIKKVIDCIRGIDSKIIESFYLGI